MLLVAKVVGCEGGVNYCWNTRESVSLRLMFECVMFIGFHAHRPTAATTANCLPGASFSCVGTQYSESKECVVTSDLVLT
jgi:hypothetical protein